MIRECVGFVEEYIRRSHKPEEKTENAFVIDDIFLSIAKDDEKSEETPTNETTAKETPTKSGKKGATIFLIFPFENSENGLKLKRDKVVVAEDTSELLELDVVKGYNYSNAERIDLKGIFEAPEKHIGLVSDNNKRIGGSTNLSSSVIYAIKIASCKRVVNSTEFVKGSLKSTSLGDLFNTEKNGEHILKNRLNKFRYDEKCGTLGNFGLNNIGPELADWFYHDKLCNKILDEISGHCTKFKGTSSIIIINLIPHQDNISNIYATIREEYFKQNVFNTNPQSNGTCMNCQKPNCPVEAPEPQIGMDTKKLFLKHPTMMNSKSKPIFICHDCALKYAAFFGLLKKWNMKILPLFVEPKLQTKEIRLMNENGCNTFSHIFNQIGDSDSLEFYLILFVRGELKYFDYVCNYNWKFKWNSYSYYYPDGKITRGIFEEKVRTVIEIKNMEYFDKTQKGLNNLQLYLKSLLEEKVFNFVYRNQNYFTKHDIWQLCILPFEQLALGSQKEFKNDDYKRVRTCLEIWFNQESLLKKLKEGSFMSIEKLREDTEIGDSPEKWAYRAGKIYRFLVSKQAGQKNLELEPIIRSHQIKNVKDAIVKKFEQRSYAFKEEDLKKTWVEVCAFDKFNEDFKDLKPYFYAGYIDQITKEENRGESNE